MKNAKDFSAKIFRVYYGVPGNGFSHGGNYGSQWLCDIGIFYKTAKTAVFVYEKVMPLQHGEPKVADFKKACDLWLEHYVEEEKTRKMEAKKELERAEKVKKLNRIAAKVIATR